jgi:uncharacterized protein (DUF1330 family)
MPKGYVILTEAIHDPETMRDYERASTAPLLAHHGRILAVDEDVRILEGRWHGTRTVLVEFPTVDDANAWYESEDYRAALPLRQAAAECNVALLTGFSLPASR